jgi:hypothetical protein
MAPADITLYDELRSLQGYLAAEFTSDEIRLERPSEDEPYDMLIEPPQETTDVARGTYMAEVTMPLTIQRWCSSYLDAADVMERLRRVFIIGHGVGSKMRIPVWKYPLPGSPTPPIPDPLVDTPDRFLKVDDLSIKIMPAEQQGQHVVICDVRLSGWRITHEFTDQLIETVDINPDLTP